jgi:hypothetical protein
MFVRLCSLNIHSFTGCYVKFYYLNFYVKAFNEKEIKLKSNFYNLEIFSLKLKIRVFINGHCIYRSIQLIILNKTLTLIVMTFKKYSKKSHYKVNKLVRIKKSLISKM